MHHLHLSWEFAKRDLKERYAGTSFGQLWLIISPVVTIFIYTVIFSDFMKMKLGLVQSKYAYSIYLIPGLLSWNFFISVVSRLSNTVFDKANIIKKINIPLYVYYISILLTEFIIYSIAMIFGILFLLLIHHPVTVQFLWLVPLAVCLALFAFSLGVIFSLFNPFFKDLKEIIPIVLQLWFWMTPIVYVKEMIYKNYPFLVDYNPLYYFIDPLQNLFLYGKVTNYKEIAIAFLIVLFLLIFAAILYKKLISEIKDII